MNSSVAPGQYIFADLSSAPSVEYASGFQLNSEREAPCTGMSCDSGIAFNYDREDSVKKVQAGEFQLAFIIKPVRPETIKAISDASDRMPRKSTYFYPKLPSGLVVNRLV